MTCLDTSSASPPKAKRKRAKGVSLWMDWYYRNREARNAYNRQQMRDRRAGIKGNRARPA